MGPIDHGQLFPCEGWAFDEVLAEQQPAAPREARFN